MLRSVLRAIRSRGANPRGFSGASAARKPMSAAKLTVYSASGGLLLGAGYSFYTHYDINKSKLAKAPEAVDDLVLETLPEFTPTRKIIGVVGDELQITLFQYQTCPFCSKLRAFLDCHGFSYTVVEVDAVLRQAIRWSKYKKVPMVLVKTKDGYRQLTDSSVIVSVLSSYLYTKSQDVDEIASYYPTVEINDEGIVRNEVLNKYFLMFERVPVEKTKEAISDERKWRRWADDVLVHTISPNVYRTLDEAYETFEWFAKAGEWHENFPAWEVRLMINVGAVAMWTIAKRLKKKYNLREDVRMSIYDECNGWMKAIKKQNTKFKGGNAPDLSDLAVYGVLSSMEGCSAFQDVLDNTSIRNWYYNVKEVISKNKGMVQKE